MAAALLRADNKCVIALPSDKRQACVNATCEQFGISPPKRGAIRDLWLLHRSAILSTDEVPVAESLRKLTA